MLSLTKPLLSNLICNIPSKQPLLSENGFAFHFTKIIKANQHDDPSAYLFFPPVLFCGELTKFKDLFLVLINNFPLAFITASYHDLHLEIHPFFKFQYPVHCGLVPSFLTHPLVSPGPLKLCFLQSCLFYVASIGITLNR